MPSVSALSATEVTHQLTQHPAWELREGKLYRRLVFEDFVHAFGFMTQIAMIAEKINHHPEWANVYRTLDIYLTTHDAGGISERDFQLVAEIDRIVGNA